MVAAAKLRRSQQRIEALRPYAGDMIEMMTDLATYSEEALNFALMKERPEVRTVAVVAVTGDRGLAGAFNANVVRKATRDRARPARGRRRGDAHRRRGAQGHRHAELPRLSHRAELAGAQRPAGLRRRTGASPSTSSTSTWPARSTACGSSTTTSRSAIEQTLFDDVILPVPREAVTDEERSPGPVTYLYEPTAHVDPREPAAGLRGDRRLPRPAGVERQRAGRAHDGHAQRQRQRRGDGRHRSPWRSTAPVRRRSRRRSSRSWPAPRLWDEPVRRAARPYYAERS